MQAAAELFERFGYDKTTIEDISRRTGKAKTSIYYYYDGKQALLRDIVTKEFDGIREKLERLRSFDSKEVAPHLRAYLKERVRMVLEMKVYPQFIVSQYSETGNEAAEAVGEVREEFNEWERQYFYDICNLGRNLGVLNEGVKPDAFADMLLMLLKSIETQYVLSRDKDAVISTFNAMVDFLIRDCEVKLA